MSTPCAEQHNFQPSHQLSRKVPFKDIEIPPRKIGLLSHNHIQENATMQLPYETSLHKYLPSNRNNHEDEDNDADPYATDHFRIYEFKVRRCTRSRSHDWTDCPFAHPGEKAGRRDPSRYRYSSTICSDFRRGAGCPRGDDCDFAHGVFECWLHPTRYRTEACKDGKTASGRFVFFAHSSRELRLLPEASPKYKNSGSCSSSPMNRNNHCCLFCHSVTSSPTSSLLGLSHLSRSPSLSPPLSPMKQRTSLSGFSPISRYSDRLSKFGTEMKSYKDVLNEWMSSLENMNFCEVSSPMACGNNKFGTEMTSYKDVLNELMSSLENMNFCEVSSPMAGGNNKFGTEMTSYKDVLNELMSSLENMNFCEVSSPMAGGNLPSTANIPRLDISFKGEDQQQFVLSPSRPSPSGSGEYFGATSKGFGGDEKLNENGVACDPDLGWVNELLM